MPRVAELGQHGHSLVRVYSRVQTNEPLGGAHISAAQRRDGNGLLNRRHAGLKMLSTDGPSYQQLASPNRLSHRRSGSRACGGFGQALPLHEHARQPVAAHGCGDVLQSEAADEDYEDKMHAIRENKVGETCHIRTKLTTPSTCVGIAANRRRSVNPVYA